MISSHTAYYYRALCENKLNGNQQAICGDYEKAIKYQGEKDNKIIDSAGLAGVCRWVNQNDIE